MLRTKYKKCKKSVQRAQMMITWICKDSAQTERESCVERKNTKTKCEERRLTVLVVTYQKAQASHARDHLDHERNVVKLCP